MSYRISWWFCARLPPYRWAYRLFVVCVWEQSGSRCGTHQKQWLLVEHNTYINIHIVSQFVSSHHILSLSLIRSYFDCDVMRYGISSAPHWRLLSLSLCVIDAKNSVAIHNTRHRLCQSAHRQSNRIQNIGSQWSLQIQWNFDAFFGSNAILHDALLFLISCLSPIWLVVFECALILATQSAVQRMLSIGWIAVSCRSSRQLLSNSAHTTNW